MYTSDHFCTIFNKYSTTNNNLNSSSTSNQLHRDYRCCQTTGLLSPQLLTLFSQSVNHSCCYINTYFKCCWNWSWLCRGCYVRREVQQRNWVVFALTGAVASELASKQASDRVSWKYLKVSLAADLLTELRSLTRTHRSSAGQNSWRQNQQRPQHI